MAEKQDPDDDMQELLAKYCSEDEEYHLDRREEEMDSSTSESGRKVTALQDKGLLEDYKKMECLRQKIRCPSNPAAEEKG